MKPVRKLYLDPDDSENISRVTKWRWEKKLKTAHISTQVQQDSDVHNLLPLDKSIDDEEDDGNDSCLIKFQDQNISKAPDIIGDESTDMHVDHQTNRISKEKNKIPTTDSIENPEFVTNAMTENCTSTSDESNIEGDRLENYGISTDESCITNDKINDYTDTRKDDSDLNTVCFEESQIKKLDIMAMATAYSFRHNLSKEALVDLLSFVDVLAGKNLKLSTYFIDKQFLPPDEAVIYHFYCISCKQFLESWKKTEILQHSLVCSYCNIENIVSPNSENYFIMLKLEHQLELFLKKEDIQDAVKNHLIDDETNEILDVHQGEIYKNRKHCSEFTYNFSTDGAPVFASSKLSMWPLQLIINELPPKQRFRNVIMAGIWFGKSEPNMNLFMKKFVENANIIAIEGITWNDRGQIRNSKFLPLVCSADSVAKCMIQNVTQFNGFYGCPYCHHPGKIVNKQVKYPQNDEQYSERTPDSMIHDMQEAYKYNTRIRGVKGPSALMNLPEFNVVWGYSIDYMHCVLLGVVRMLMDFWTTYNFHSENKMYIGKPSNIQELNKRLGLITPASEIHRLPRPVTERAKWKATEWRSWLLYYGVPCLFGILDKTYLSHFMLLQNAVFILLQTRISVEDLNYCSGILNNFVQDFQFLYGMSSMNFNVHLLTHLTKSVKMCGPLWSTSCFSFESNIHNIKKQINGPRGIAKQVIYKFLKHQYLNVLADEHVYSPKCKEFLSSISHYKTFLNNSDDSLKINPLGKGYNKVGLEGYSFYDAVLINNIKYTTTEKVKTLRYNDSFIKLKNNSYCKIINIYKNEGNVISLDIKILHCISLSCNNFDLKNCFKITEEGDIFPIHPENILAKCVFIKTAENSKYICDFPNNLETQ